MWLLTHPSRDLASYADGQLAPERRRALEAHLADCTKCRAALDDIRFAAGLVRQLAQVTAPDSVWTAIESALPASSRSRAPSFMIPRLQWAMASLAVLIAAGGLYWYLNPGSVDRPGAGAPGTAVWAVDTGSGTTTRMAAGEWIETTAGSRARITVGSIGTVDVEPGTRVQLGSLSPEEHRIALARGTISAKINAPPRLFIVDTPTSTVVDLGCAYTMHVDESGGGELRMTEGWASLEWKGRESLVPAGAMCRTRPGVGPGTPFFDDASPTLREALASFDFDGGGSAAVAIVLREARGRDTLSLWHLLSRVVDLEERARVYDRIAQLSPVPDGVSREKALQLDPATLKLWREELAWTW